MSEFSRRSNIIAQEASEWLVALDDGDEQTRKAFVAWLRVSPEHIKEFLCIAAIWGTLPQLAVGPPVEELARLAMEQPNVLRMPHTSRPESRNALERLTSRRRWLGRAAAVFLGAVGVGAMVWLSLPSGEPAVYTTLTGEQSSVAMPDGSLVTLNTRSTVRVAYSEQYRDVHLTDGEALFDAARDVARPFRVITDQAVIEAIGTQFNVRKNAGEVTISVLEGIVDVSFSTVGAAADSVVNSPFDTPDSVQSVRLTAGQQARVESGANEATVVDTRVENAIAWRQHRLVFDALPLQVVIEEFNRYNDPPTVIADRNIASLPISGVFRSNDRESFLQFLSQMQLAESTIRADGTIVLKGRSSGQRQQ